MRVCCTYRTAKRKEQISPSGDESTRILAMTGSGPQQNSTRPVSLLVRMETMSRFSSASALHSPRRTVQFMGLHNFVVETLLEV